MYQHCNESPQSEKDHMPQHGHRMIDGFIGQGT
ncbi:hypothetical protein SDC9_130043 [bioreactor metagenome]|uniref:Uncharacterized protein n=1 Tax=bioreactor metagenome TaxID=1076179 RepID=A0A645D0F3_9ZZZZ